jgi:hypothetical protein
MHAPNVTTITYTDYFKIVKRLFLYTGATSGGEENVILLCGSEKPKAYQLVNSNVLLTIELPLI